MRRARSGQAVRLPVQAHRRRAMLCQQCTLRRPAPQAGTPGRVLHQALLHAAKGAQPGPAVRRVGRVGGCRGRAVPADALQARRARLWPACRTPACCPRRPPAQQTLGRSPHSPQRSAPRGRACHLLDRHLGCGRGVGLGLAAREGEARANGARRVARCGAVLRSGGSRGTGVEGRCGWVDARLRVPARAVVAGARRRCAPRTDAPGAAAAPTCMRRPRRASSCMVRSGRVGPGGVGRCRCVAWPRGASGERSELAKCGTGGRGTMTSGGMRSEPRPGRESPSGRLAAWAFTARRSPLRQHRLLSRSISRSRSRCCRHTELAEPPSDQTRSLKCRSAISVPVELAQRQ